MSKQASIKAREARLARELAARRAARKTRVLVGAGGFVIVALLVAIVAVVATSGPKDSAASGASPGATVTTPANTTATGAIMVGKADAPVKLEIYLDYMCPYCGRFEKANSADIETLVKAGKVRVELHPLGFL